MCISSRHYAWRPKSDRELVERYLPFPKLRAEAADEELQEPDASEPQRGLNIFVLEPLDEEDIRIFARHRSVPEVGRLIRDLERLDLTSLAGRPFDLEAILDKWASGQTLGGRSELLEHNVKMRLKESHDPDRARQQPLNLSHALTGARRLAAAVVLTGEVGIHVPDAAHTTAGIDAGVVLSEWDPADVQALLERALFNDVIYGAVRFRHREVREFLAAGWFSELLQRGYSRNQIVSLFFREQYGHQFVAPRLRALLPWLILDDDRIRSRILADYPEIAMEDGDPARLPLPVRESILSDVVERVGPTRGVRHGRRKQCVGADRAFGPHRPHACADRSILRQRRCPFRPDKAGLARSNIGLRVQTGTRARGPDARDLRSHRRHPCHHDLRYRGAMCSAMGQLAGVRCQHP